MFAITSSFVFKDLKVDLKITNQKSLQKAPCSQPSHHNIGLGRSCSPIPVFMVFPLSPSEVLTHSWLSQVPIQGEAEQCLVPSVCNKVTGTQHLSSKKNYISNWAPWHIRSSRNRAGNGIFKESNMLEKNELLNPPSYCPVPNSKQFKTVSSLQ